MGPPCFPSFQNSYLLTWTFRKAGLHLTCQQGQVCSRCSGLSPDRLRAEIMLDHWSYITHLFFFKTVALMKRALTKRWSLVKWGDLQCKMCICTSEIYISSSFNICFHSQVVQIWSRANWTPETVQTKPQMRQPAHTNQNEMLLYKIYRWLETLIFCLHTG